jgi:broad specificity phosphatase PhoE
LREFDCGIYEGRSDEAAWKGWQRVFNAWYRNQAYDECIEQGETFHNIWNRFVPFIQSLVTRFRESDANILCVSHGGVYCLMLPLVVRNINHELIKKYGFDYTTCIVAEFQPEGLTCVEWNGNRILSDLPNN